MCTRSQGCKAGVKKLVKNSLARAHRQSAKRQLAGEVLAAGMGLTQAEQEAYADAWLAGFLPDCETMDEIDALLDDVDDFAIPANLEGALPEWMMTQFENAHGDTFALLSLFEVKSVATPARISMDDELLYA